MSQKLGFPYLGIKANILVFFIGILLATLNFLFAALAISALLTAFLTFLGAFLTGWALLGFAVMKELLPRQRLIAFFFAVVLLSVILGVSVGFSFAVS